MGLGELYMKRLSELNDDDMVFVEYENGYSYFEAKEIVITKLEDDRIKNIYDTEKEVAKLTKYDIHDILINFTTMHDEWEEEVYDEMIEMPEWLEFVEKFNEIAENHPTYIQGEKLLID